MDSHSQFLRTRYQCHHNHQPKQQENVAFAPPFHLQLQPQQYDQQQLQMYWNHHPQSINEPEILANDVPSNPTPPLHSNLHFPHHELLAPPPLPPKTNLLLFKRPNNAWATKSYHKINIGDHNNQNQQKLMLDKMSALPRKWCDFVFRRNTENNLYKSDSFRFIQKTSSLDPLLPKNAVIRNRLKATIPICDDYIEPLDQLITPTAPEPEQRSPVSSVHSSGPIKPNLTPTIQTSASISSTSSSGAGTFASTSSSATSNSNSGRNSNSNLDVEPPYHEVQDNYNAPYYYSDTLKDKANAIIDAADPNSNSNSIPANASEKEDSIPAAADSPSSSSSGGIRLILFSHDVNCPYSHNSPVNTNKLKTRNQFCRCNNNNNRPSRRRCTESVPTPSPTPTPTPGPRLTPIPRPAIAEAETEPETSIIMARKRYETAFLPNSACSSAAAGAVSSSSSSLSNRITASSPDLDMMLRSIETIHTDNNKDNRYRDTEEHDGNIYNIFGGAAATGNVNRNSNLWPKMKNNRTNSSCGSIQSGITIIHCHPQHSSPPSSSSSTTDKPLPPQPSLPPVKIIPFSEPLLPQKKYISYLNTNPGSNQCNNASTTATSSRSSCCSSSNSSSGRGSVNSNSGGIGIGIGGTRFCPSYSSNSASGRLLNLKDTSVSSLESIDSLASEDNTAKSIHGMISGFNYLEQRMTNNNINNNRLRCAKLLSPISDKSPLDPSTIGGEEGGGYGGYVPGAPTTTTTACTDSTSAGAKNCITTAAEKSNKFTNSNLQELSNVPWEMPKLRRKLAMLGDSGISLDFTSNSGPSLQASGPTMISTSVGTFSSSVEPEETLHNPQVRRGTNLELGLPRNYYQHEHHDRRLGLELHNQQPNSEDCCYYNECVGGGEEYYNTEPTTSSSSSYTGIRNNSSSSRKFRPDKGKMKLDFGDPCLEFDPTIELDAQEWFHGAITRIEAENILRATKEGSFLVRNCESSTYCRYSLSIKSARGFIHIRIEPNSYGMFSLAEHSFPSVCHLVLHFMSHRLPIKGAEHVKLKYPVITQLL